MTSKKYLKRMDATYESQILNAFPAAIFGAKIFSLHTFLYFRLISFILGSNYLIQTNLFTLIWSLFVSNVRCIFSDKLK